jgi:carbon-monoxide dehydrogenase large subunit
MPGYAEAVNIIERLIDKAARQWGFDRAELRRINLVPGSAMPMRNALGNQVNSGDFPAAFAKALARAEVAGFTSRQQESTARGLLRGLGLACHIKGTGGAPQENVEIRFEPDGTVLLITGTQAIGQGHETSFPQILADRLGLPNERIRLVQGDTDRIPLGGGHGSSRATYMGGTAIWHAGDEIITKGTRIAADVLEAAVADIRFEDGRFVVAGTDRGIPLLEVAATARAWGCAARHLSRLDAAMDDLPQRHARRRSRDRSRHRQGDARPLYRRRRLRGAGQSNDRRRPGARRDRTGDRPGIARTRRL